MDTNYEETDWLETAKNFQSDLSQIVKDEPSLKILNKTIREIDAKFPCQGRTELERIKYIFTRIYNSTIMSQLEYMSNPMMFIIHPEFTDITDPIFDACLFTALCMFIHDTKQIKSISLRKFLYQYSSRQYNKPGTSLYFDWNKENKVMTAGYNSFLSEETAFRQMRKRLFSTKGVYIKRSEGSAMPEASKHEWSFEYVLMNLDDKLKDTYKRIRNLGNPIIKLQKTFKESHTLDTTTIENAYKQFAQKLKKIDYESYLELQKEILLHIQKNETYYGINIYRFEKSLRLYNITHEVNLLLSCKNETDENDVLLKSILLQNIWFPKLYDIFSKLKNYDEINACVNYFTIFLHEVVYLSLLIMDKTIEKGYLGDDWKEQFLDIINNMTESVFYNPKDISYTIAPKSQEKFEKLLSTPIYNYITSLK